MSRRNRRDLQSRDFVCSCGKAYLSYPALHTHIRKYHEPQENMLSLATMPKKEKLKRGRPTHNKTIAYSEQLDQLTFVETSILKIYEQLSQIKCEGILLQGDQEVSQQQLQNNYQLSLHSDASSWLQLVTNQQLGDFEQMVRPLADKLIKHFTMQVSVRLKVMLMIGCIQHQVERSERESCVSKMASFGWGFDHLLIGQILFDVLMRALQRRSVPHDILTTNDE